PHGRVSQDLVQPTTQVRHLGPGPQCRERVQECLLNEVIGACIGCEMPRERIELAAVALNDRSKRALVARASERHEPLVALRAEEPVREPGAHTARDAAGAPDLPARPTFPPRRPSAFADLVA